MNPRSRLLATAIVACICLLPACAQPTPTPVSPTATTDPSVALGPTRAVALTPLPSPAPTSQTFTLGLAVKPGSLDPANAEDETALMITRHLYEGLVAYEPGTTRVQPALAESWDISPDGRRWTFNLRRGITFTDGAPLTAEAAAQNFRRWLTRTPPGRYAFWRLMFGGFAGEQDENGQPLSLIEALTATSPSTLVLTTTAAYAPLLNTLAMPSFALVSPTAWTAPNFGQPGAASAGTGSFVLKAWSKDDLAILERNPNYWGRAAGPDEMVFKIIPDDTQRLIALQVGEIDGLARLNPKDYDVSAKWPIRVEFDPALEVLYLGFNQARPPWNGLECRTAVALALNRERYVQEFFPGDAQVASVMQPPGVWGYAEPESDHAYDVEAARAQWARCKEAAAVQPEAITLYVPPIPRDYLPQPKEMGEAIQADLAAAGISVTVASPDWQTAWLPEVQSGRADLFLLGWVGVNGDPDSYLCALFCGANAAFNTNNRGLPIPPDDELAQTLRAARLSLDPAAREQLYAQAHARIAETLPALPLAYRQTAWAFRSNLHGTIPSPIEAVFFNLTLAGE
jgi:peptide/nickel transport system substrate-binding protein